MESSLEVRPFAVESPREFLSTNVKVCDIFCLFDYYYTNISKISEIKKLLAVYFQ